MDRRAGIRLHYTVWYISRQNKTKYKSTSEFLRDVQESLLQRLPSQDVNLGHPDTRWRYESHRASLSGILLTLRDSGFPGRFTGHWASSFGVRNWVLSFCAGCQILFADNYLPRA